MASSALPTLAEFRSLKFSAGGPLPTQWFSQPLGALLAWGAGRGRLTPNQVTAMAMLISIAGVCMLVMADSPMSLLLSWCVLQVGYGLDCADGQLARATGRSSRLGQWWDVCCDFIVVNALALGALKILLEQGYGQNIAFVSIMVYLSGRALGLFSSTMARQWLGSAQGGVGERSLVRRIYMAVIDTPSQITLLVLCRSRPEVLAVVLVTLGLMSMLHGFVVGRSAAKTNTTH